MEVGAGEDAVILVADHLLVGAHLRLRADEDRPDPGSARGESLGFTATVRNNTDSLIVFEAWTGYETPWGHGREPALGPVPLALGPHAQIAPHIDRQQIPPSAPFGSPYTYEVFLGTWPTTVLAHDAFEFAIVPPRPRGEPPEHARGVSIGKTAGEVTAGGVGLIPVP